MAITLHERPLRRALLSTTAVISVLGLTAELIHHRAPSIDWSILPFLSLSVEGNLPTWYSSLLLFGCGVLLLLVGAGARQSGARFPRRWTLLGAIFTFMSLDEAVELHEQLVRLVQVKDGSGVLHFSWVIPAAVIVLGIGLAYIPFLLHLPSATRRRFIAAGLLYVGGALFLELPLGWWTVRAGEHSLGYALIDWVEETMEMLGATLFLLSLFRYLREHHGELRIPPPEPT
jgi:hypothetical protein